MATATAFARERLLSRARGCSRVVVSAPAGYGKSVLARQLADRGSGPVAWCGCGESDRSGGGAAAILSALVEAFPHLGDEPPVVDGTGSARLAWALAELAGPGTVVIDDAHLLGDDGGVLPELFRAAPVELTVIAVSDADPPAPLIRGIADGEVLLIGAEELLFDEAECKELLARSGTPLDADELLRRSGGWPLAAGAIARHPGLDPRALAVDALGELPAAAIEELWVLSRVASLPDAALAAEHPLRSFARRHPALVELSEGRVRVRGPARDALADHDPVDQDDRGGVGRAAAAILDRLDRAGHPLESLVLSARVEPVEDFQLRLADAGPVLLDAGRHELIRELVAQVPPDRRTVATVVLDAQAELDLDDLRPPSQPQMVRVDERLAAVGAGCDEGSDEWTMVAGVRVEALRRRGDPELVAVALAALDALPPLDPGVEVGELVDGRGPLTRRSLHQVLNGLGAAAGFSGDPSIVEEGRRLCELGFAVAESAGVDSSPIRAQRAYERVVIGLDHAAEALAPLEAGIDALRALGRPDAANMMVELADLHGRLGRPESGLPWLDAAQEWAERTGNQLALPSIELARSGLELIGSGPSESLDQRLEQSWRAVTAAGRLRRAAPGFAVRIANTMLDHGDVRRAETWLRRAAAAVGGVVQRGYQLAFLEAVDGRRRMLAGELPAMDIPDREGSFVAQPAGWAEAACTIAWDRLRAGDPRPARQVAELLGGRIPEPWDRRLAGALGAGHDDAAPKVGAAPQLHVRLLVPSLAVERAGRPVPAPSGHAGRLLALLVVAGSPVGVDALIEDLWPEVDPSAASARNRFHQVVHRLRRALGVGPDGPVRVEGGSAWLDASGLSSDVAQLRSMGAGRPERLVELLRGVRSELCAAQFGYDAAFDEARWELSRLVVDAAAALLGSGHPDGLEVVAGLATRLPDEGRLAELLASRPVGDGAPITMRRRGSSSPARRPPPGRSGRWSRGS